MRNLRVPQSAGSWLAVLAALALCVGCTAPQQAGPTEDPPVSAPTTDTTPQEDPSRSPDPSGSPDPTGTSAPTSGDEVTARIEVALYGDGSTLSSQYALHCSGTAPVDSGGVPDAAGACAAINENPQILSPRRAPDRACTEIYGGPDRAVVSGTLDGEQLSTEFTRTNGCRIAEWDAVDTLLGGGGL